MDALLSKDELLEMNRHMLGLGMPDCRDDVGYNKPDWCRMTGLGYMPELTDLQAFAVADTLGHYKNTQLQADSGRIEATHSYYKDILKDKVHEYLGNTTMFRNAYLDYCKEHKIKEFLQLVYSDNKGITIHYDGFVGELNDYKNKFRPHIRAINDGGQWNMYIEWDYLQGFLDCAYTAGRLGYIPSQKMQEAIDEHDERMKQGLTEIESEKHQPIEPEKPAVICGFALGMAVKTSSGDIQFALDRNDGGLRTVIFDEIRATHILRNVDYQSNHDRITFFCNEENLEKLMKFLEKNNIEPDKEIKDYYTEFVNFRKSDIKLIDLDKCPLPFKPYDFQIEDAKRLVEVPRSLIGHDMGCGKTLIATAVGESIGGKKLAIVPETLRLNWVREIRNVHPDADIKICKSNDYQVGNDWTICGYATVAKFRDEFEKEGFNVMFIDEAHNIKAVDNWGRPTSKRAEAVMSLAENIKYVYPMTGTPLCTNNRDLYNILKLLRSDTVKKGFYDYGVKYCDGYRTAFGFDATGNSNQEELHEELAKLMVRRTKAEVLPDLKKQRTFIPIDSINRKYLDIEKRLNHPKPNETFMGMCMTGRNILSELKIPDTVTYAESLLNEGRSIVIVTEFNNTMDMLKEKFKGECSVIRGGMTDKEKQQNIDDFQNGKNKVCLLNLIAGGVGVTLTKAHDMIIMDYDWTPSNMIQVEDRICRAGQSEEFCNIFYIYCEKALMDSLFIGQLSEKNDNISRVIDGRENDYDIKGLKENNSVSMMQLLSDAVKDRYGETEKEKKPKAPRKKKPDKTEEKNAEKAEEPTLPASPDTEKTDTEKLEEIDDIDKLPF